MKSRIVIALITAIGFQLLVLIGMVTLASAPLWTGTEVKIKTIPVDPRSLFRGNYARLRYDISEIHLDQPATDKKIRNGEVVYVLLEAGEKNIYHQKSVTLEKPVTGLFIRGRISHPRYHEDNNRYQVKYGIEAFFAPKEKALALEDNLREEGIAVLMVSPSGKARLKNIISKKNF